MRRRERRSPELARLDALGAAGRRRELQRIVADLDEPAPTPPAPTVDVEAAVRAELRRQREAAEQAAAAARYDAGRSPSRTPCSHCGLESIEVDGGQPWWIDPAGGYRCALCESEFYGSLAATDANRKLQAITRLLNNPGVPIHVAMDTSPLAVIPVWHREHPGAPPAFTMAGRFGHVNVEQLRARWERIAHPRADVSARFEKGEPCKRCGCDAFWASVARSYDRWEPVVENGKYVFDADGEPVYEETTSPGEVTLCAGCSLPHSPGEVPADMNIDEFTAIFVLRDPRRIAPHIAEVLGVRWWSELGQGDRHRRANSRPFEHIDMPAVRARAAELWPDDSAWSAWRTEHAPVV